MNKKIIIAVVVCFVVVAVGAGFYLFIKKTPSGAESPEALNQAPDQESLAENEDIMENQNVQEISADNNQPAVEQPQNKLVTDDFSIDLPDGWRQAPPVVGATAMAVNANETSSDPAVQKINFKTYVAVSHDTLEGKTIDEYLQNLKSELQRVIEGAVFTKEHDIAIGDKSAHAMEAEMVQQGINFKVLMVVMAEEGEDVWVISFNTTQSNWDGYVAMFYDTVNTFRLKK
ncbi:MAG: hypothetical protein PHU56_03035 [Candidatus Pacebacteria bacterium]|nr:hypothetical protein [Candidatus Paceibacterota bacterium]